MINIFKRIISHTIFLLILFIFPLVSVNAQQASQRWVCLNAERVEGQGHTARVSVDPQTKLLPSTNTYIFECISSSECTSGDSTVDQEVFGKDNQQALSDQYGYRFVGSTLASNPLMSDSSGEIPEFKWHSSTDRGQQRRWLALNYFQPVPPAAGGDEGGQQQGTFDFETVYNQSDCVALSWDPYGRVFDSQTLEPVNQAQVTLYKKTDTNSYKMMTPSDLLGGNIINPQITNEDGSYSFVVPDGTYKLTVSHSAYNFPEALENLHFNYSKIYSDIYPSNTGVDIIQKGVIQHRDIPLKNIAPVAENKVKLMQYFYDLDKLNNLIVIRGRTSHPFSEVKAYSLKDETRYRLLTETPIKTDKDGNFTIKISQSDFELNEYFGEITIEKTDLTLVNLVKNFFDRFIKQVNAEVNIISSTRFEPILNNVEGYAKNNQGDVLQNTKVSVYLEFSKKPYYETISDENGYFKISSENLPSMPYHIEYGDTSNQVNNNEVIKIANSRFVTQNKEEIIENNTNLNVFKTSKGEIIEQGSLKNDITKNPSIENNDPKTIFSQKNKSQMFILFVIILLLVFFSIFLVIYLKKRQDIS